MSGTVTGLENIAAPPMDVSRKADTAKTTMPPTRAAFCTLCTLPPAHERLLQEGRDHVHAVALHFLHYNFAGPHQSLGKRTTRRWLPAGELPVVVTQVAGLLDGKVPSS